jgi:hypothetical protein
VDVSDQARAPRAVEAAGSGGTNGVS